ncbi:hypothetical protein TNCV_219041 [Trichonephila clavipes]|nr:hypothetical protein TNCV_219041 [Trichonephila clavipes]
MSYNRLARPPNISFQTGYYFNKYRNLKTQKSLFQCIPEITQYHAINDNDYELLSHINPLGFMVIDMTLNMRKNDLCGTAVCVIALYTIHTRYPLDERLHIYTDCSLLDFTHGAGAGDFCDPFFLLLSYWFLYDLL